MVALVLLLTCLSVPLGARRRFGPAPVEETNPPQLAQPSPSAYPRQPLQEPEMRKGREETPNGSAGKSRNIQQRRLQCRVFFSLLSGGIFIHSLLDQQGPLGHLLLSY